MKLGLRTKVLLSVGLIIFVVLGTSTFLHIQDLKQDYLESFEWRSEALAQNILREIVDLRANSQAIQNMLGPLALQCIQLYELNKEKNVSHFAVINASGVIAAHNDRDLWNIPVESPVLLEYLQRHERVTVLDGTTYHTLIPFFGVDDAYAGSIDIGVPKSIVDEKVQRLITQSVGLFVVFSIFALFATSVLVHVLVTKPIRHLVSVGQKIARGEFAYTTQTYKRNEIAKREKKSSLDEIGALAAVFYDMIAYLQDMAHVATRIATGDLSQAVTPRSEGDVLGTAFQRMSIYLNSMASVATAIAKGDLTETVDVRSTADALGRAIQAMTKGLHTLIVQIRTSAEQIASTGSTISSLATRDIGIVQDVHTSVEQMTSTMMEMESSVEEVAHNMDTLSSSVEETSASVSQMTASIAHIAANTTDLTQQTYRTIESLNTTVRSLEGVVESTDESKQLAQGTIQDALEGQQAVEQVMISMETIQQTVTTAVEAITQFAQRSRDIDTILDVIREITEQTSLLALNAAIIAAQAGAHGRGFAVVADEIKSLAEGVGSSTKDIATIVQTLQQDTNRVVQSIHAGAANVDQGMERTQQARETLGKIITSAQQSSSVVTEIADTLYGLMATSRNVSTAMEQVNAMTDDITAATTEQETSTKQINQAIGHINDMASQIQQATTQQLNGVRQVLEATQHVTALIDRNLESSQHIAHTTETLSSQAGVLLQSVDRFKLSA